MTAAPPGAAEKVFFRGTHRVVPPAETFERLAPVLHTAGITRVANITGLDHIGIPVVIACRPNSRGLAVSQGKGLDLIQAKVSAVMESLESYHAERITAPLKLATEEDLKNTHAIAEVAALPMTAAGRYRAREPRLWIEGDDLVGGKPTWVPYEVVETNYTYPLAARTGCFQATTNGLASGNHLSEAVSHALCELIERDARSIWRHRSDEFRAEHRLDIGTIDDLSAIDVLDRLDRTDIDIAVWDVTSDIELPCFVATAVDRFEDGHRPSYAVEGAGCHPSRVVALLRAILEAVQSRLTFISGARDDNFRDDYEELLEPSRVRRIRATLSQGSGWRSFRRSPDAQHATVIEDVQHELRCLRAVGIREAIAVDLARPEIGIPVVRVVVPGLEGVSTSPDYLAGARAQAVSGGHE